MKQWIVFVCLLITVGIDADTEVRIKPLPALRDQAAIQQEWLKIRLERVLPEVMRKNGISMWLMICREYNEDPAFFSLVSPETLYARRRTIFVFFDRGPEKGIERLALGGGSNGGLYQVYRDPDVENRELWGEGQWALLRKVIEDRNPSNIAIDISRTFPFSDGLSASEYESFKSALGEEWQKKLIHSEMLPVEYLETRIPEMESTYKQVMEAAHSLIARAFSNEVIVPGKTTNQDVVWWLRQESRNLGFGSWFHPSVRVQRQGAAGVKLLNEDGDIVIQRGDVLHTDFGVTAMNLHTDTQHMGYVLREGEDVPPEGIQKALLNSNRLQDLLLARMKPGKTGNEVLLETLSAMKSEGINGSVYTHPIGDHGHGAGPLIGMWDRQQEIPGRGDVKLVPNSWFAIELSATTPIPEWGNEELWVGQEEDAILDQNGVRWVLNRQTKYHLIR